MFSEKLREITILVMKVRVLDTKSGSIDFLNSFSKQGPFLSQNKGLSDLDFYFRGWMGLGS